MQSSSQLCHPQHFSLPPSSRFYPLNSQTLSTSSHLLQHPNATHHSHRILLYNFLSPYIYDHSENRFPKCSHRSFSKWSSHGITLLFTQNSVASHSLQIKTCFSVLHGLVSTLPFQILLITTTLFQMYSLPTSFLVCWELHLWCSAWNTLYPVTTMSAVCQLKYFLLLWLDQIPFRNASPGVFFLPCLQRFCS